MPHEELRARLVAGTWLALRDDARTGHVFDESWLDGRTETVRIGDRMRVIRITADERAP